MSEPTTRPVTEDDIEFFFEMQKDPESVAMADFPPRERDAYFEHWKKIFNDPDAVTKTIVLDGEVVGHLVSWIADEKRYVGYWIARSHWGRGIASAAFPDLLAELDEPYLYAITAPGNHGSNRILQKNGFTIEEREENALHWMLRRSEEPS